MFFLGIANLGVFKWYHFAERPSGVTTLDNILRNAQNKIHVFYDRALKELPVKLNVTRMGLNSNSKQLSIYRVRSQTFLACCRPTGAKAGKRKWSSRVRFILLTLAVSKCHKIKTMCTITGVQLRHVHISTSNRDKINSELWLSSDSSVSTLLWQDPDQISWVPGTAYRFKITFCTDNILFLDD